MNCHLCGNKTKFKYQTIIPISLRYNDSLDECKLGENNCWLVRYRRGDYFRRYIFSGVEEGRGTTPGRRGSPVETLACLPYTENRKGQAGQGGSTLHLLLQG